MNDQPPTVRRRFRYGLRTLIALVTLVAVAAWIYAVGWPWWQAYYEQLRFERIARQLQPGVTTADVWMRVGQEYRVISDYSNSEASTLVGVSRYELRNAIYFVCFEYPQGHSGSMLGAPSSRVEVYRLPLPPRDYLETRSSNLAIDRPLSPVTVLDVYTADFEAYYAGGRQDSHGLRMERIHVNPPRADDP